jgi:hypothetical protein
MTHRELPMIFVLDWDHTIVGRVDFQSHAFSLARSLKSAGIKPNLRPVTAFSSRTKLVRPGFAAFIKAMEHMYGPDNVFFFIFTASERSWATYEIGLVEKAFDIRFARPIFARDDCTPDGTGNYRKSINHVFPRICRVVGKTHPLTAKEKQQVLENNLIIIDNKAVYSDRTDKLLLCPDYKYSVFENLLDIIPTGQRNHHKVQQIILSLANSGMLCPLPKRGTDYMSVLATSYDWLAQKCRAIASNNAMYENDDFWVFLRKLIERNNLRVYSASVVKQLQDAVWKRVKSA